MNNHNSEMVDRLRGLCRENKGARVFLVRVAGNLRGREPETTVDDLMKAAEIDRAAAVKLFRVFETEGWGQFVVGRRGWESRILWAPDYLPSLRTIAEEFESEVFGDSWSDRPLTIAEAKRGLAVAYGVQPEAVEIIIRG